MMDEINTCHTGFALRSTRGITMADIVTVCQAANALPMYEGMCTFVPEPISEGGIQFVFLDETSGRKKYKSMRLNVSSGTTTRRYHGRSGEWPFVRHEISPLLMLAQWLDSELVVMEEGFKFTLDLKSFDDAPSFTQDELRAWEPMFAGIGLVRTGKFPTRAELQYSIL